MCNTGVCPECSSVVPNSFSICPNCGYDFDEDDFELDVLDYEAMQQAYAFEEAMYE